ncbi:hypothetical protein ES703_67995 [subsurface metagenome]
MLAKILHVVDRINEWSGKGISFLVLVIVALIVYEVFLRYVLNSPTLWNMEVVSFSFGVLWVIGGAYALVTVTHVKMEVLYARFGPRGRAIFDLISAPFFYIFIVVLLWQGWEAALRSIAKLECSMSLWAPPVYPIKMVIPLGALLLLLQGSAKWIRDLITATTGKKPA